MRARAPHAAERGDHSEEGDVHTRGRRRGEGSVDDYDYERMEQAKAPGGLTRSRS